MLQYAHKKLPKLSYNKLEQYHGTDITSQHQQHQLQQKQQQLASWLVTETIDIPQFEMILYWRMLQPSLPFFNHPKKHCLVQHAITLKEQRKS